MRQKQGFDNPLFQEKLLLRHYSTKKVGDSVSIWSGFRREKVGIALKHKYRAQAKRSIVTLFRSRPVPDFHPPNEWSAFSESMKLLCCVHIVAYKQMFVNSCFVFVWNSRCYVCCKSSGQQLEPQLRSKLWLCNWWEVPGDQNYISSPRLLRKSALNCSLQSSQLVPSPCGTLRGYTAGDSRS